MSDPKLDPARRPRHRFRMRVQIAASAIRSLSAALLAGGLVMGSVQAATPAEKNSLLDPAALWEPAHPFKGSSTGLPIPRFISLLTDDVNMRVGPGFQYPIEWVYKRRGLPVEVEREFDVWRLVLAPDGGRGWVHEATVSGTRTFIVTGGDRILRRQPNDQAATVAMLQMGVIGVIRRCKAGDAWCEVSADGKRGYLPRADFWGTFPGEAVP
jgi:SH3-like domain-containing protein